LSLNLATLQRAGRTFPPTARRHVHLRRQLLCADISSGLLSGVVGGLVSELSSIHVGLLALTLGAGWPVLAYICGLYAVEDLRAWASGVGEAHRLAVSVLVMSWPAYALVAALGSARPGLDALAAATVLGCATGLTRAAARAMVHRTPELQQRTIVLGSGQVARELVQRLQRHRELGLDAIGFLDDDAHEAEEVGIPRLGTLADLDWHLDEGRVDRVMIAFTRASHEDLLHALRVCRDAGVTVDVVPRLFEFLDGARLVDEIGGMPLLSIQVPCFSRLSHATKRALDICLASIALLTFAPILLAICVAIKLDTPGPIFFKQARAGRRGRYFTLYKFRSMRMGSNILLRDDGAIVKTPDDARVTRVGQFLRRFSLDEFPQLLNIVKGDMSLVGPRPLVVAEHDALTEVWQGRRADLRPGLTGPWQVAGRSHIPFHDMVRFDYQYVAGWSLARDIEILLATVPAVLTGRGAY
jgi:exopolysaccharide biosynthesis polyprenyl glycosylphosphotransferase